MEITYKRLQNLISSYESTSKFVQKPSIEPRPRVDLMLDHNAEPIDMLHDTLFQLMIDYIYTHKNKKSRSRWRQKNDTFLFHKCRIHV
jgi:hypothetical protein